MEADEEGTRARLRLLHAEVIEPRISADGGRIVKTTGDGMLVEFPSAVDAVRNALSIQDALAGRNIELPEFQHLVFRIGINLGDVIIEGDDIHGDGVNVAARLEGLCEPGAVYISSSICDQVAGKIDASFDDLGEQIVKNIARPIRVYWVRLNSGDSTWAVDNAQMLPLPTKPSIAVLPFKNLSDDPAQDKFVDGLRLAIQATLVQIPGLFLLAPPAVANYRNQEIDAHRVGRRMGVRYVLEGAAQRSGERIRVTVQLTDAAAGQVVWAERYDRALAHTLEVQDEITVAVVSAVDTRLVSGEILRGVRGTLTNLDALESFYRGLNYFYARSKENIVLARRDFEDVYRRQPDSPIGPALLSMCHWLDASMGWADSKDQSLKQAVEWAEKTVGFEFSNGLAHVVLAGIHLLNRRHDEVLVMCYQGLDMRPTCPMATVTLANVLHYSGYSAEAVPKVKAAMRLMHVYPPWFVTLLAAAYRDIGDVDQSIATARQGLELSPQDVDMRLILCSDYSVAGLLDHARETAQEIIEIDPAFSLSQYADTQPYKDEARLKNLIDSLREVGLPT